MELHQIFRYELKLLADASCQFWCKSELWGLRTRKHVFRAECDIFSFLFPFVWFSSRPPARTAEPNFMQNGSFERYTFPVVPSGTPTSPLNMLFGRILTPTFNILD